MCTILQTWLILFPAGSEHQAAGVDAEEAETKKKKKKKKKKTGADDKDDFLHPGSNPTGKFCRHMYAVMLMYSWCSDSVYL